MFRLRVTSEVQPRSKNGQPAQSTTGVAKTSSSQVDSEPGSVRSNSGPRPGSMGPIASTSTGTVSAAPTD